MKAMLLKKVKLNTLRQITFRPCGLNVYDSVKNNFVHYFNMENVEILWRILA